MRTTITRTLDVRDATGWPSWRVGMAQWQWKELAGTSLSSVPVTDVLNPTGPAVTPIGRIDAWNGLAADRVTGEVYLARAGGHADWAGNEVYKINLNTASPSWSIIRQPTVAPDIQIYQSYNADGRPASTHLYYALQICRARNRLMTFYSGSLWGDGNQGNVLLDAFRLADNDWDAAGTFSPIPVAGTAGPARALCQDPVTEDVYVYSGGYYRRWRQSDATWQQLAAKAGYANDDIHNESPSAVDTLRGKVLFTRNAYRTAQFEGVQVDTTTGIATTVTFGGSHPISAIEGGHALEYIAGLDKFLLKSRLGNALYEINPVTFAVELVVTTGGSAMPSSGNGNGIYNRFRYIPALGGCMYLPGHSANFWFLATE